MKNIAIILAGGNGTRFGHSKPKQFLKLAGKMIIEHTLDTFENNDLIDEIAVITNSNYTYIIEDIVNKNQYTKVKKILNGGKTRNESSLSAINAYFNEKNSNNINLIFHDAVRPFVSNEIIHNTIKALDKYNAVDVAIPASDTIISVENFEIDNIPNRSNLNMGQTPQGFKLTTIKKAYDIALKDIDFRATDDCGVIIKYLPKEPVFVVPGEEINMKITYEIDLFIADKLFQIKKNSLNNFSPDFSLLRNKTIVVFGGSYGIGKEIVDICKKNNSNVFPFSRSINSIDIKNNEDVKKTLEKVYETTGQIDYIINTAAILKKEIIMNMSYDSIQEIININYLGNINIIKESFDYLKKTKGSLLLFTSSSYSRGRAFYSLYSSTKAAVVNLTQALAEEWSSFNINVNCINPERTKTPMRIKNFGTEPINSLLDPKIVAEESIKTLLTNITGQIIYVKK